MSETNGEGITDIRSDIIAKGDYCTGVRGHQIVLFRRFGNCDQFQLYSYERFVGTGRPSTPVRGIDRAIIRRVLRRRHYVPCENNRVIGNKVNITGKAIELFMEYSEIWPGGKLL